MSSAAVVIGALRVKNCYEKWIEYLEEHVYTSGHGACPGIIKIKLLLKFNADWVNSKVSLSKQN